MSSETTRARGSSPRLMKRWLALDAEHELPRSAHGCLVGSVSHRKDDDRVPVACFFNHGISCIILSSKCPTLQLKRCMHWWTAVWAFSCLFCFHTAKDACILTEMAFVLEYFRRTPAAGCFSRCFPQSLLIAGGSMRVMRASAFSLDHPRFRTRKTGWYGCYGKSNFGRASANS